MFYSQAGVRQARGSGKLPAMWLATIQTDATHKLLFSLMFVKWLKIKSPSHLETKRTDLWNAYDFPSHSQHTLLTGTGPYAVSLCPARGAASRWKHHSKRRITKLSKLFSPSQQKQLSPNTLQVCDGAEILPYLPPQTSVTHKL